MRTSDTIKELTARLTALIPQAEQLGDDIRTKIEQVLQKGFKEMNLLTREEFAASQANLERLEQRINELEQTLAKLEDQAGD